MLSRSVPGGEIRAPLCGSALLATGILVRPQPAGNRTQWTARLNSPLGASPLVRSGNVDRLVGGLHTDTYCRRRGTAVHEALVAARVAEREGDRLTGRGGGEVAVGGRRSMRKAEVSTCLFHPCRLTLRELGWRYQEAERARHRL